MSVACIWERNVNVHQVCFIYIHNILGQKFTEFHQYSAKKKKTLGFVVLKA